jgi:hypothetical protein
MIGLALAVSVDPRVGLAGIVVCDAANSCTDLGRTFDARRTSQSDDPLMRLVGAQPLLERMKISTEGTRIAARVDMSTDEATNLVERLVLVRQAMQRQAVQDSLEDKRPAPAETHDPAGETLDAGGPDASSKGR